MRDDWLTPLNARAADAALSPYRAGVDGPWGPVQAGHALRRTQFGGTPALRARVEDWGPLRAAVELTRLDAHDAAFDELLAVLDSLAGVDDLETAQSVWLTRMIATPRPFEERLALFWHGHFATSVAKVGRVALMVEQVDTLRRLGAGRFGDLAKAVSRDPAMILWLDGNTNRRHHANENYARELLELFCLGHGNYSEADVLEAARAFSGWHESGGRFRFVAAEHDDGDKTVLGRRGPLDGDDVVDACLAHPACPRWIAGALLRAFVHPAPGEHLVDAAAARLLAEGYDVHAFLRHVFASRAFHAPRAVGALVKSPVELAVGAARALDVTLEGRDLARRTEALGQSLYAPPSVKGWDGGRAWLNAATTIGRVHLAARVAERVARAGVTPDAVDVLLDGRFPSTLRDDVPPPADARAHVTTILASPEAQLS